MFKSDGNQNLVYGCNIYGDLHVLEFKMSHTMVKGHMSSICMLLHPPGGVLNFELGTDVRPEVSNTTL